LGCGEGGDVLWLAEQGWRAHGLDISATAVGRAREEAAARGLENASFTATDLSAWRPDPDSADLVTASFFQSNVELDRIAILRTAASALRSGGHLVVISHASPPPWAGKNGPQLLSARDDAAELDLPSDEWIIEEAGEPSRPATGPYGQHARLLDAVLVARRRQGAGALRAGAGVSRGRPAPARTTRTRPAGRPRWCRPRRSRGRGSSARRCAAASRAPAGRRRAGPRPLRRTAPPSSTAAPRRR